ncbi:hypothetical protein ABW21_db0204909 [Orbilia brochopaga]|nr:hypothetical protein ABW21_db0204909 [Drechslerella brochopaga]
MQMDGLALGDRGRGKEGGDENLWASGLALIASSSGCRPLDVNVIRNAYIPGACTGYVSEPGHGVHEVSLLSSTYAVCFFFWRFGFFPFSDPPSWLSSMRACIYQPMLARWLDGSWVPFFAFGLY